MSELKATKGPYEATGASVIFAEDGNEVARVDEDREGGEEVYTEHLMAASWDMYHAIKNALDCVTDMGAKQDMLDAMAKARGES